MEREEKIQKLANSFEGRLTESQLREKSDAFLEALEFSEEMRLKRELEALRSERCLPA